MVYLLCSQVYGYPLLLIFNLLLYYTAQSYLCACLRCAVSVAVIPVCKGEQDIFTRSGFQRADVSVPVIGIGGLHAVTMMDAADAVQGIIAVAHFQSVIIKDADSSAQTVIVPCADVGMFSFYRNTTIQCKNALSPQHQIL